MPSVPYSALHTNLRDEITYALTSSPTLKIFSSDIEVAYAEAEGTQSTYYPQVDLQVSGNYGDNIGGVETYEKGASALLVANWNLYRGGADVAREREYRYRHEQAKAQYSKAARALEDEIRSTWAGMVAAGNRAEKYDGQTAANAEVVKAYKDQFTLNRRTLLDVLDAQNELYVSKVNKINAEFVQMFSVYRLVALRGELFSTLGIPEINERVTETASAQWSDDARMKAR
jgi:adhesin transport system outer membrane protein